MPFFDFDKDGNTTANTAASAAEAVAGTDASKYISPATLTAGIANVHPSKAARPGLISAGTSAAGITQDNTGLAFGTGDVSFGFWLRMPDWTPASVKYVLQKYAANLGLDIYFKTNGRLAAYIWNGAGSGTEYSATANVGTTDGAWAFIVMTLDRDGNLSFYENGALLGTAVSIAAQSAQTITSTGPLSWGASSGGTSPLAGTLGETFIVSGLLSASRIADIYRAGSIAPFCAYTANTTTGQNTATVDALSFYQWLDFGQGYGPIIRDRSGNNQHALIGTTGIEHAVKRNPPGIPQRAPRAELVGDGSNGSFLRSTLNAQNPGTGECMVWVDFLCPTSIASDTIFVSATSSTSEAVAAKALLVAFASSSSFGLHVQLMGLTTVDVRRLHLGLTQTTALLGGKRVVMVTGRGVVYLGIDGEFFNATNLFQLTTGGTAPAWTDEINATVLQAFYRSPSISRAVTIYDLRLANVAMTEAQLRTEYERGEPGPEWSKATKTALYTSDFSAGVDSWANQSDTNTITGNVDAIDGANDWLSVQRTFGGVAGRLDIARTLSTLVTAQYYEFSATIFNPSGSTIDGVSLGLNGDTPTLTALPANARTTVTFKSQRSSGTLRINFYTGGNFSGNANGQIAYVRAATVTPIGYTARLRTDTATGLTALNGAKSSTNDSTDFLFSTTGITTSPDGRTQTIRATTTTNGNEQLFGASVIDTTKNWRIRSWSIVSSGTPTVSLGSASAGAQYLSGSALAAAQNEVPLITRIPASANLWCNSNSTATLKHTVVLELVD